MAHRSVRATNTWDHIERLQALPWRKSQCTPQTHGTTSKVAKSYRSTGKYTQQTHVITSNVHKPCRSTVVSALKPTESNRTSAHPAVAQRAVHATNTWNHIERQQTLPWRKGQYTQTHGITSIVCKLYDSTGHNTQQTHGTTSNVGRRNTVQHIQQTRGTASEMCKP